MSSDRLLVVHEQIEVASLIAAAALGCGYYALSTTDSAAFRNAFTSFRPTLVALDLGLPEEAGVRLLEFLAESGYRDGILTVSGAHPIAQQRAHALAEQHGMRMIGKIPGPFRLGPVREQLDGLRQKRPEATVARAKSAARRRA